jgi:ribosome-associated protein
VTLWFDVLASPSLDERQRQRILERLAGRIGKDGMLRVVSQRHRTQEANRRAAVERFHELVEAAVVPPKPRKATRASGAARRRRLDTKRRRAEVKRGRGRVSGES